jgi:hypothetical protein
LSVSFPSAAFLHITKVAGESDLAVEFYEKSLELQFGEHERGAQVGGVRRALAPQALGRAERRLPA